MRYAVLFWLLLAVLFWIAVASGQPATFTIARGMVTATQTESSECYYQIGREAMIVFQPGSTPCQIVQHELLGRYIRLQAVIETFP